MGLFTSILKRHRRPGIAASELPVELVLATQIEADVAEQAARAAATDIANAETVFGAAPVLQPRAKAHHAASADWRSDTFHDVSPELDPDAIAFQLFLRQERAEKSAIAETPADPTPAIAQAPTDVFAPVYVDTAPETPNPDVAWAMRASNTECSTAPCSPAPKVVSAIPASITPVPPAAIEQPAIPIIKTPALAMQPIAATAIAQKSAREMPAVLQQAAAPAEEVRQASDPLVEQLILLLMKEASQRSDGAVSAYENLSGKASAYAARSRRSAKTAWSLFGAMAATMLLGGVWASYTVGRATAAADMLKHKVAASTSALAERDHLRTQLSAAYLAQFQTELDARAAQQVAASADVELESYQRQAQPAEAARAAQPAAAPATPPTSQQAAAAKTDVWATLLGN